MTVVLSGVIPSAWCWFILWLVLAAARDRAGVRSQGNPPGGRDDGRIWEVVGGGVVGWCDRLWVVAIAPEALRS